MNEYVKIMGTLLFLHDTDPNMTEDSLPLLCIYCSPAATWVYQRTFHCMEDDNCDDDYLTLFFIYFFLFWLLQMSFPLFSNIGASWHDTS